MVILYPEAENNLSDLEYMKEQLKKIISHLENAQTELEFCCDYDRYSCHIETLIDLLHHENCVLEYFIKQKEPKENNEKDD
jgi:hypothetical protein